MHSVGVDGDLGLLTGTSLRPCAETPDDRCALAARDAGGRLDRACVSRELLHLVRVRGLGVRVHVHDQLRAERLGEGDLTLEPPAFRDVGLERGVLEVLRPDADDHRLAVVAP